MHFAGRKDVSIDTAATGLISRTIHIDILGMEDSSVASNALFH